MPKVRPQAAPFGTSVASWSVVPTLREPRFSQSLERGLAILACFTPECHTLGIADIADDLGMSRSTTHRYVITLVALGYLEQGASRKYRLGLRVSDLGFSVLNALGLREHAKLPLEELRKRSTFTVNLAVLDGKSILYVQRARSFRSGQHLIDLGLRVGSRLPAPYTAMGKLLLAFLPEDDLKSTIQGLTLKRCAPNSITSKRALRTELEHIRGREGFAVNNEELAGDLYSIAVPVYEGGRVVAAVNMAAHSSMISLEALVDEYRPGVTEAADAISARMSGARDGELVNGSSKSQHG